MPRMFSVSREHDPRPLDDPLARVGQQHLPRVAFDQLDAELLLQLLDLGRQRRLAHEAGLGGLAEVAVLGHRDEILQVAQVHGRSESQARAVATP